jgi:hypothetical protein
VRPPTMVRSTLEPIWRMSSASASGVHTLEGVQPDLVDIHGLPDGRISRGMGVQLPTAACQLTALPQVEARVRIPILGAPYPKPVVASAIEPERVEACADGVGISEAAGIPASIPAIAHAAGDSEGGAMPWCSIWQPYMLEACPP